MPTDCGLDNGRLIVDIGLTDNPSYSLDNITFQKENVFENLPPGNYTIYVEDDNGCELFTSAFIEDSDGPTFSPSVMIDDRCDRGLGQITINAQGNNLEYSIDGVDFQTDNVFNDLSEGDYVLSIKDDIGLSLIHI